MRPPTYDHGLMIGLRTGRCAETLPASVRRCGIVHHVDFQTFRRSVIHHHPFYRIGNSRQTGSRHSGDHKSFGVGFQCGVCRISVHWPVAVIGSCSFQQGDAVVHRRSGCGVGYWVVAGFNEVDDYIGGRNHTCTRRRYRIAEGVSSSRGNANVPVLVHQQIAAGPGHFGPFAVSVVWRCEVVEQV